MKYVSRSKGMLEVEKGGPRVEMSRVSAIGDQRETQTYRAHSRQYPAQCKLKLYLV